MGVTVQTVEKHSPASRVRVQPGDVLERINGHAITDFLDYNFYASSADPVLYLKTPDGKHKLVKTRKAEYDDLGLGFETYLMDQKHSCRNKCMFCFVDQMPGGMRESLYFKDDDERLSFLFGNYITLTNLSEHDVQRIIDMKISPINVSVHTTDPALRVRMMKNKNAGKALAYLGRFAEAGIRLNCQLVLCPGINDGEQLEKSLRDLGSLYPAVQSIACVPVGLTKYREGLEQLTPYTPERAAETLDSIHAFSDAFLQKHGERVAYPADEFFLKAGRPIPDPDYYGDFAQLENGVGLLALLESEYLEALAQAGPLRVKKTRTTLATGMAAYGLLDSLVQRTKQVFPDLDCEVAPVANRFFGENITVAGLLTGADLMEQLAGRELGDTLLIPAVMLRHEGDCFLDDVTPAEVEKRLGVRIVPVENDGEKLLKAVTGIGLPALNM